MNKIEQCGNGKQSEMGEYEWDKVLGKLQGMETISI